MNGTRDLENAVRANLAVAVEGLAQYLCVVYMYNTCTYLCRDVLKPDTKYYLDLE